MKNKNILEVCLSPDLGGLELFVVNCFKSFKQKTNCQIVVAPNKKLDKYFDNKDKHTVRRSKFCPFIPAYQLAKLIDKYNIDIVHFHWTKDILPVVLAKKISKNKPQIVQTRHMTMTRFKSDFYHKWLYKNISTIHCVTKQVGGQIDLFIPEQIRPKTKVIYMGTKPKDIPQETIDNLRAKHNLKDSFIVGLTGRIDEAKGQYILIEAMAKLKKLDIKALIIGDTMEQNYLKNLKDMVKTLNIQDKIIFTGFTKQVDSFMKLLDVSVLATKNETFGLVVIEAMANKVCTIATNKGGPLEIIEDGVDGLLFDRTSKDLANKINLLYHDKEYKNSLAEKGCKKVKELFDFQTQSNKLYDVLLDS